MKSIILDIDGTLVDSMGIDLELYFSSVAQVLGPVRLRDLNDYDHITDSGILGQILEENGFMDTGEITAAVKASFIERLKNYIRDVGPIPVIDGAVQFVERIRRSSDMRIAIATGCWRESALLKLRAGSFEIEGIPMATSDDLPSRVEIMRAALKMTGSYNKTVMYFGDAEWDQRACQDLGWDFVAVGPRLGGIESYAGIQI